MLCERRFTALARPRNGGYGKIIYGPGYVGLYDPVDIHNDTVVYHANLVNNMQNYMVRVCLKIFPSFFLSLFSAFPTRLARRRNPYVSFGGRKNRLKIHRK
jgi:hypothetical protein